MKHGAREATIEIEIQRETSGPNASRRNPVVSRLIKRDGNKSTFTVNGNAASGKAVLELARSFDIQIEMINMS